MTTKKRISRVVAVALALCLVAVLAVPSFAASSVQPRYVIGDFQLWNSMQIYSGMQGLVLSRTPVSGRPGYDNVTANGSNGSSSQQFAIEFSGRDGRPRMYNSVGYNSRTRNGYAINMNTSNYSCITWSDTTDNYSDAEINALTRSYNGVKCMVITLPNRSSRSLTMRSNIQGSLLYWDHKTEGVNQLWHCATD